jgi:hypothetical protein
VPTLRYIQHDGEVWNLVLREWKLQRYLPPTSFDHRVESIIGTVEQVPQPLPMVFTDGTGWRNVNTPEVKTSSYHVGLDVVIAGAGHPVMNKSIIAPEDGAFSIMAETPLRVIELPDGDVLDLSAGFNTPANSLTVGSNPFNYRDHGAVGVLVTNPQHPKEGRVYLYLHLGQPEATLGQTLSDLEGRFRGVYGGDHRGATLPRVWSDPHLTTWVAVVAGEWIGQAGNHGISGGPHVHLEVLEYFERTSDGEPLGRWRRVDPRSVFRAALPFEDTTQGVEATLVSRFRNPDYGKESDEAKAKQKARDYFRPWALAEGQ